MNADQILTAAADHLRDRAAQRDTPEGERSMGKTVAAFNAISGHTLTEREGWMFMVMLKAVRACATPDGCLDSHQDGAAYFALAGEGISESTYLQWVHENSDLVPEDMHWVAMDSDRRVFAFIKKPAVCDYGWGPDTDYGGYRLMAELPEHIDVDWRESLVEIEP